MHRGCLLHAIKEGYRQLESVHHSKNLLFVSRTNMATSRKLKQIDYLGIILALGGSTVIVVCFEFGSRSNLQC